MSEVADLTNAGRTDIIPGYTLCRPGLEEIGAADQQCAALFLASVRRSTEGLLPEERQAELEMAQKRVAAGDLAFGSEAFTAWAFKQTAAPFLILMTMQRKHPKVTYAEVCALCNAARDRRDGSEWQYHKGALELMGYDFAKKDAAGAPAPSEPNGASSSPTSASQPPPVSDSAQNSSAT